MIIHTTALGCFLLHLFLLIYHPYPPSFHELYLSDCVSNHGVELIVHLRKYVNYKDIMKVVARQDTH